jgi:hypothetical protein
MSDRSTTPGETTKRRDDLLAPDDWGGDLLAPSGWGLGDGLLERDDDWQCLPDFSRKKRRPRLVLVE